MYRLETERRQILKQGVAFAKMDAWDFTSPNQKKGNEAHELVGGFMKIRYSGDAEDLRKI